MATAQRVAASGSQENSVSVPDADVSDLGRLLRAGGYAVFLKKGSLYAFKGLAGRFAPIGVHISMLAIILGESSQFFHPVNGCIPEVSQYLHIQASQRTSFACGLLPHHQFSVDAERMYECTRNLPAFFCW